MIPLGDILIAAALLALSALAIGLSLGALFVQPVSSTSTSDDDPDPGRRKAA